MMIFLPDKIGQLMRILLLLILCIASLLSEAQVSGQVIDSEGIPVYYATVFNLKTKTGCVTDSIGFFTLNSAINDSVQIRHLNYNTSDFKIGKNNDRYLLASNNYYLDAVVVSADAAFKLFKRSCEITFNKLKDRCISRGYLRYMKTVDNDTVIQNIDMDIERQKLKSFDKGEKISIYKIQERTVNDSTVKESQLFMSKRICPPVNQVDWDKFSKYYNYFELEDSLTIKLYFINKILPSNNQVVNLEVIIQKEDTSLMLIANTFTGSFVNKIGAKTGVMNSYSYIKYRTEEGYSFLSETYDRLITPEIKKYGKNIELSLYYKTYDNGFHNSSLRLKGNRMINNFFSPRLTRNRFTDEFWKNPGFTEEAPYDFERLRNLKLN